MAERWSIRAKRKRAQQPRDARPVLVDPAQLVLAIKSALPQPPQPSAPISVLAHGFLHRKCPKLASGNSMEGRVKLWLLPYLGGHTDETLRAPDVADWLSMLSRKFSKRGKPLSAQTIRHTWDAARQIVQEAINGGEWRGSNPFAVAGAPAVEVKEQETLSLGETAAMLRAIPPLWQAHFAAAIYLGMSRSALRLALKSDLDRKAWTIWLAAEKTRKRRLVPVPYELQSYLSLALSLNPSSERLFGNPTTGAPLTPDSRLCPMLRRALRRLGIVRKLTFHGLRRVSSSLHQEAGCHPWVVSRILGHSQAGLVIPENTTSRRYTKFSEDFVRRELNRLSLKPAPQENL